MGFSRETSAGDDEEPTGGVAQVGAHATRERTRAGQVAPEGVGHHTFGQALLGAEAINGHCGERDALDRTVRPGEAHHLLLKGEVRQRSALGLAIKEGDSRRWLGLHAGR